MNGRVIREVSYNIQCRFCSVFDRVSGVPKQRDCERHWRGLGWRQYKNVGWVCAKCVVSCRKKLHDLTPKPPGMRQLAVELVQSGMSMRGAAKALGLGRSTLHKWFNSPEQEEKRRARARLYKKTHPEKVAAWMRDNRARKELAKEAAE